MTTPALSPLVAIHMALALAALILGPLALWARKGSRLHRAAGFAWVTLMAGAALSSLFILDVRLPNVAGYTPIHLLTVVTFFGIGTGVWHIAHGRVQRHRRAMQITYVSTVVAGAFALLPSRHLGQMLWHHWLGLV